MLFDGNLGGFNYGNGWLLEAQLCYPFWTNWTKVVSTSDKVDRGVTRLCRIKTYEDWFKLKSMVGIWRDF